MQYKLDELKKKKRCYAINLFFGEDIGCDDFDTNLYERNIQITCIPEGYCGEIAMMFKGKLREFLIDDLTSSPKIISNPPQEKEYQETGWYIWGTNQALKYWFEKNKNMEEF